MKADRENTQVAMNIELRIIKPKYKILIVDDCPEIIDVLKRILKNIENAEVEIAHNGIQAWCKMKKNTPNLVILDADMPGCTGEDVVRKMKQDEQLKKIKILGYTGIPAEGRCFEQLGVDKVIIKSSKESEIDNFTKEVIKLLEI